MSDPVRRWLIAYDIRCPRRLARVHRVVSRQALPLQYSVFCGRMSRSQVQQLADELDEIIAAEDDVRLYALGERPWYRWYGPGSVPDAIWLIDNGPDSVDFSGRDANFPVDDEFD